MHFDAKLAAAYAREIERHPVATRFYAVKARSMLSLPSLLMIRAFAIEAQGNVLEIGPYIGGGTVAAALGLAETGSGRVLSVDRGGCYDTPLAPAKQ